MREFFERAYKVGSLPWEDAAVANQTQLDRLLARERDERGTPPGRALDVGCGRGVQAIGLAASGWQVSGVDYVPTAIAQARQVDGADAVDFIIGDATDLLSLVAGPYDFVLDVGCLHGFTPDERRAYGEGVTSVTSGSATMLMLAFAPGAPAPLPQGIERSDLDEALPAWEVVDTEPVPTEGLPFPQVPVHWYRLRRKG